tara:strand:- start:545 stop:1381 length:837 start_codon:yes stop_codon:yes gene_type:complete
MAARTISATQTLEDFRTQFNALSSQDFGDIATLSGAISATSIVGAVNELQSQIAGSLAINITDGSNTQSVSNAQTITFAGAANQIVPTVSATDTVTYALRDNVTIAGNFTASGSGTHTLGSITFASSTIASSGATVTVDDNLSLSAGKTLTADNISSSQTFVDFGAKDIVTSGFFYTSAGPTEAGIVFEGSSQDDFETLIKAVEPTADRTITIPNETGTIVTTGSSAVVTGTMIAADTVAEANMANDAIGQDQLKSVVTLQILNSGGTVVKTLFGAGA